MFCPVSIERPLNEVDLSRALRKLQWASTEKKPNHNIYRNHKNEIIGFTVFAGRCDCWHYIFQFDSD